jgi:hypothetical protein
VVLTPLSCNKCGAPLTEKPDGAVIRCSYCGQTHWLEQARSEARVVVPAARQPGTLRVGLILLAVTVGASSIFLLTRNSAPSGSRASSAGTRGPGDPSATYTQGEAVDIHWGSSWWPGTIRNVKPGGSYRIAYDGYASSWDEDVDATRLRQRSVATQRPATPATPAGGDPNARYQVGQSVQIHWGSSWWPGRIVSVSGDRYQITYDGWSSSHDETVDATRLRLR